MPTHDLSAPRDIESTAGNRWVRKRLVSLLVSVLDEVDSDGPMPQGKPHAAFDFLPELIRAVSDYSSHTYDVYRETRAHKMSAPDTATAAAAMNRIARGEQ